MNPLRRLSRVALAFVLVALAGTAGYVILGFGLLDALYQTVTTITTVGFREVHPLTPAGQMFTMALILVGAGTVFYMSGVLLEALIEGHLRHHVERRRMDRRIERMRGHIIVCGWGRVGRSTAQYLRGLARRSWPSIATRNNCGTPIFRTSSVTSPTTVFSSPPESTMPTP